jgi:CelD/BcsL family acetyltransferase involved in cellulose biosynthesis
VGYLYNFVLGGRVSNYQTAFAYETNSHLKPGLVSHTLAIEHAYANGSDVYDFLMGEHRYKRSMAKNSESMVWLSLSRGTWRLRMRMFAKRVAAWLRR